MAITKGTYVRFNIGMDERVPVWGTVVSGPHRKTEGGSFYIVATASHQRYEVSARCVRIETRSKFLPVSKQTQATSLA